MRSLRKWLGRTRAVKSTEPQDTFIKENHQWQPTPDMFPVFPPPPPAEIVTQREEYQQKLRRRRYEAPMGEFDNNPLYGLYRIYEYLVVDHVTGYRNHIEFFWKERDWAVQDIPDPKDEDHSRYAFLACVTFLLVKAFNEKIKLGLPRWAPAIISPEQAEKFRNMQESEKKYEHAPKWAEDVDPLPRTLVLKSHDDVILESFSDERADALFKTKNILVWSPHIHFT